eukprot:3700720-Prymnesium_polylepis.1
MAARRPLAPRARLPRPPDRLAADHGDRDVRWLQDVVFSGRGDAGARRDGRRPDTRLLRRGRLP